MAFPDPLFIELLVLVLVVFYVAYQINQALINQATFPQEVYYLRREGDIIYNIYEEKEGRLSSIEYY